MFPAASGQLATADRSPAAAGDQTVLRSVAQIDEFAVTDKDAKIGYVRGLLIETRTWSIRYLIVDTGHSLPGKLVLLSPPPVGSPMVPSSDKCCGPKFLFIATLLSLWRELWAEPSAISRSPIALGHPPAKGLTHRPYCVGLGGAELPTPSR